MINHAEDYFDHVAALRRQGVNQDGSPCAVAPAMETPGQIAYETDCERAPLYQDKTTRKTWEQLPDFAKESWEKSPTPR